MSQSSSCSNSSYAEILKTVTTVKTVKSVRVEKFSPVKASTRRAIISSTPSFKRKRCQIESFSPIISPDQVENAKNDAIAAQSLRFTVRRRKNISVNKSRRHVSSKSGPECSSIPTQTETEDNLLIEKYIVEVAELKAFQVKTAVLLQLEKERCFKLRATVSNVLERAEIAVDDAESQNLHLNDSILATKNPDFSSPAGVSNYHAEINRAVKIKSRIHNGLLSSLNSIKKECFSSFSEPKHQINSSSQIQSSSTANSTKKVTILNNNLSDYGILNKRGRSSDFVPRNPNVMFLRAPNNKSVKFRVPLEEFLSQGQTESTNILINVSHEKIEIEIPKSVSPHKIRISQGAPSSVKIPDNLNLSLLNISQNSTRLNEPRDEWDRFASTKHAIDDDDVGSLLNYSSSSSTEVRVKKESTKVKVKKEFTDDNFVRKVFTKAEVVRFTDTDDQTDSE